MANLIRHGCCKESVNCRVADGEVVTLRDVPAKETLVVSFDDANVRRMDRRSATYNLKCACCTTCTCWMADRSYL